MRAEREQAAISYGLEVKVKEYLPNAAELNKRLKNLEDYGFNREDIIKIIRKCPNILDCTAERTAHLLQNFEEYGFGKEGTIRMVKKFPVILSYAGKRTNDILLNLERYGFAKAEIVKMVRNSPAILICTSKRTNSKILNLERYGFIKEEIIVMVRRVPALFSWSAERTGKLIEWFLFYRIEINLVERPEKLIFSLNTLEARRKYLEEIGFDYQKTPYALFRGRKRFFLKFGIEI